MKRKLTILLPIAALHAAIAFSTPAIHIANGDTSISIEAGTSSPVVLGLEQPGCPTWIGQPSEALAKRIEIGSHAQNISWTFNAALTQASPTSVRLVYEATEPHLRLFWEWRARSAHGPLEHSIRIQNLSSQEIWFPMQDSLQFAWQLPQGPQLNHLWIEKGAGGPSAEGTHWNTISDGYKWTGESSTYAHPAEGDQREMIPYTLVETADEKACRCLCPLQTLLNWSSSIQLRGDSI